MTRTEFHTWQLTAHLRQDKVEDDGDIHLVIKDNAGRSMIAETPSGRCVPATSRWKTAIATARHTFTQRYAVSTS